MGVEAYLDFDIPFLVSATDAIVIGTVRDELPARWTTRDGTRPANPHTGSYGIYRPVVVDVEQVIKGQTQRHIMVNAQGGQIGQDLVSEGSATPLYTFTKGEHVLLFLSEPRYAHPEMVNGVVPYLVDDHYTLMADGHAKSYHRLETFQQLLNEIQMAIHKR